MTHTMKKIHFILFLFLLISLGAQADKKPKRKRVTQPDAIPAVPALKGQSAETKPDTLTLVLSDSVSVDESQQQPIIDLHRIYNSLPQCDTATWQGKLQWKLDSLCNNRIFETTQLGMYVYDITDSNPLFAVNHRHRMRPASCEKLVTAISALHYLGGRYQLTTDLRVTGDIIDSTLVGDVYVVGGMDPLLSQGDVYNLALALQREGIDSIAGHLYIDVSMKDDKDLGWGWCWDDKWGPLRVLTVDGKDTFQDEFRTDVVSVGIRLRDASITQHNCPASSRLIKNATHTIDQVLQRMMKNSNNIYAESLFYQLAAYSKQPNAGRKQAVQYINSLVKSWGLTPDNYQFADGSGLSLYNYVTPELLVVMLTHAWREENTRQHLYPSLPIAGQDGTLSSRMKKSPAEGNVHAKTGTVEGISSLSGYATAPNGHILAFSIINQGIKSTSTGKNFQDRVCKVLCGE